jgi:hypothetical protein
MKTLYTVALVPLPQKPDVTRNGEGATHVCSISFKGEQVETSQFQWNRRGGQLAK